MNKQLAVGIFILFACAMAATGQHQDSIIQSKTAVFQTDTIPVDTLLLKTAPPSPALSGQDTTIRKQGYLYRLFKTDYPNPKKALLLSAAFPGGGQIYNKGWWKLPFVWGGYALLIYSVDFNTRNYKLLRDAYIAELEGREHPFSGTRLQANDLKRLRDQYDKNKQLSYIGIVALHLVQSAEAFVDAHLKTFDVSDDLSLKVKPAIQEIPGDAPAAGVGFVLMWR